MRFDGVQSALAPASPEADHVFSLSWIMFWGSVAILVLVMVLGFYAVFGRRRPALDGNKMVIAGGVLLPLLALPPLLVYALALGDGLRAPPPEGALRIEVTGHQWWWEVRYRFPDAGDDFTTANEIHLPVGQAVEVLVTSNDVIHSFWVPRLAGKIDAMPGHANRLTLKAEEAGEFRGQCAEFCGAQHTHMAFVVVAKPQEAFEAWAAGQREPARQPSSTEARRGLAAFLSQGCVECHTVRGTPASGRIGPDLTHVGSRRTLAAGTLDNNSATLAALIRNYQEFKPGADMPSHKDAFDQPTAESIAAYLEELQ